MTYSEGPRLNATNNPGGARWCDTHNRLECKHNRSRERGPCHAPAIRGTDGCRLHVGVSRAVAKVKGESRITAWTAIGNAGEVIDYKIAVLGVLQMSWLRLAAYSELLRRQVVSEGVAGRTITGTGDSNPGDVETDGLIGHRYGAAGKDGIVYAQVEEVRALVVLEAAERDRVVKYAKTAHDMGISDRLTNLAENWGDLVATRITALLDALDLTPEQAERVPRLVESHLGSIDLGSMGTGEGTLL